MHVHLRFAVVTLAVALTLGFAASAVQDTPATQTKSNCAADNGGIKLPSGFCASVFADNLGHARHLAVAANGVVYVNTSSSKSNKFTNAPGGFIVALRDADGDGKAEMNERFGTSYENGKPGGGTGIQVYDGALYVEVDDKIVRYKLEGDALAPKGNAEAIVGDLPMDGDHIAHAFAIAADGTMYVNSGSMTNSCQQTNRTLESPGVKPCKELDRRAGVWRYDAKKTNQSFSADQRFAAGLRNAVALAVHPGDNVLFATVHDRDQLNDNWPKLFTEAQNNELPAETLVRVDKDAAYHWPYCYFDPQQDKFMLAPEYGGDGKTEGDCSKLSKPLMTFPAHWAPESMVFYNGSAFPASYRDGAFIAFHGSWNRKPMQSGFVVVYVPFSGGKPSGKYAEFATGFAGAAMPIDPMQAAYRPMGLAIGPDGALYVSDDTKGRIWRITTVRP